ncbi:CHAT domain-containing protein [Massilia sp. SYSU DXS3249]
MIYQNFDLEIICPHGGDRLCARVLESPQGDCPFIDIKWPFDADAENELLGEIYGGLRQRRVRSGKAGTIEDFGGKLFEAVFSGDIEHLFRSSLDASFREGKGLRIRLRLPEDSELHMRPWEFLFDTEGREFLAVREHTPLVRYLPVAQPIPPITVEGPLRVLVALSSPTDHPRLDIAREWEILCHALEPSITAGQLELRRVPGRCTFDNLRDSLRHYGAHIFHFVGHGIPGALILEQESGKGLEMEATHLRSAFPSGALPRLIVLNACSGAITQDVPFSGLAQGFLRQGVPAVVAMQASITDDAAMIFTRYFYRDLVEIGAVDASLTEARLRMQGNGHPIEWGTPVLYMRALSGQLFQPSAHRGANPPTMPAAVPPPMPAQVVAPVSAPIPAPVSAATPAAIPEERKRPRDTAARTSTSRVEPGAERKKIKEVVQSKQDASPLPPEAPPADKKKPRTVRARDTTLRPGPGRDAQAVGSQAEPKDLTAPLNPEPEGSAQDRTEKIPPKEAAPPVTPPPAGQATVWKVAPEQPAPPVKPAAKPAAPAGEADQPAPPVKPAAKPAAPAVEAEQPAPPVRPEPPPAPAIAPAVQADKPAPPKPAPKPVDQASSPKAAPKKQAPPPKLEPILKESGPPPKVQPKGVVPTFSLEPETREQSVPATGGNAAPSRPAPGKMPAVAPRTKQFFMYGSAAGVLAVVLALAIGVDRFIPGGSTPPAPAPAVTVPPPSAPPAGPAAPQDAIPNAGPNAAPNTIPAAPSGVAGTPAIAEPDSSAAQVVSKAGEQAAQGRDGPAKAATAGKTRAPAHARKTPPATRPAAAASNNCNNPVVSERSANCLFGKQ